MPSRIRKLLVLVAIVIFVSAVWMLTHAYAQNAPAAFDNESNGFDKKRADDQKAFEKVDLIHDGLGPVYNAQACRECHQDPVTGAASQILEKRAGHLTDNGDFVDATVVVNDGRDHDPNDPNKDIISNRNLINDRSICPAKVVEDNNGKPFKFDHQDETAQEIVPPGDTIQTHRLSLNILGDGFVEAIADNDIKNNAVNQCRQRVDGLICGHFIEVPILESAPGNPDQMTLAIGRFGWKDQHASLLSFAADAYLNEMGVTNRLLPDEVTRVCNPPDVDEPNDKNDNDIDKFAAFMRDTKAPARDSFLLKDKRVDLGERVFKEIHCDTCHTPKWKTSKHVDGTADTNPAALQGKTIFPYSDFLLHDVGTKDGVPVSITEHYGFKTGDRLKARTVEYSGSLRDNSCEDARSGKPANQGTYDYCTMEREMQDNANRLRTPPLWGVRMRSRLMHDGASLTPQDAIARHQGEARKVTERFNLLTAKEREALLLFLKSL